MSTLLRFPARLRIVRPRIAEAPDAINIEVPASRPETDETEPPEAA